MNEQERRANQALQALGDAYRNGQLSREAYRARRRTLLLALCDSDGVTARNALTPATVTRPRQPGQPMVGAIGDIAGALFPDRRRMAWRLWLIAFGGLGLCALLLYAVMQVGQG